MRGGVKIERRGVAVAGARWNTIEITATTLNLDGRRLETLLVFIKLAIIHFIYSCRQILSLQAPS